MLFLKELLIHLVMKTFKNCLFLLFAISLCASSCDRFDGDIEVPSYLEVKAFRLQNNPSDSWSQEDGFFTYNIDAVNIIIWQEGDAAETNLGTFTLPCRIPVLKNGNIDRMELIPVIKQNGIAGSRIPYPYFKSVTLNDVPLAADSTTMLDTLTTYYIDKAYMKVLWQEFFEPGPSGISLDTAIHILSYRPDTVCSGYGCGVVRVPDSMRVINFWSDTTFYVPNSGTTLYLEMDYWSDFDFSVGFNNPTYQGGSNVINSMMTIYGKPEKGWQKIYINVGRLWGRTYSHYPYIRFYFSVFNPTGKTGNLFIDNIKLLAIGYE